MGGRGEGRESRGRVFQAEGVLERPPKVGREEQPLGAGSCSWGPAPRGQSGVPLRRSAPSPHPQTAQPGDSEHGPRGRELNWPPDTSSPEP